MPEEISEQVPINMSVHMSVHMSSQARWTFVSFQCNAETVYNYFDNSPLCWDGGLTMWNKAVDRRDTLLGMPVIEVDKKLHGSWFAKMNATMNEAHSFAEQLVSKLHTMCLYTCLYTCLHTHGHAFVHMSTQLTPNESTEHKRPASTQSAASATGVGVGDIELVESARRTATAGGEEAVDGSPLIGSNLGSKTG